MARFGTDPCRADSACLSELCRRADVISDTVIPSAGGRDYAIRPKTLTPPRQFLTQSGDMRRRFGRETVGVILLPLPEPAPSLVPTGPALGQIAVGTLLAGADKFRRVERHESGLANVSWHWRPGGAGPGRRKGHSRPSQQFRGGTRQGIDVGNVFLGME